MPYEFFRGPVIDTLLRALKAAHPRSYALVFELVDELGAYCLRRRTRWLNPGEIRDVAGRDGCAQTVTKRMCMLLDFGLLVHDAERNQLQLVGFANRELPWMGGRPRTVPEGVTWARRVKRATSFKQLNAKTSMISAIEPSKVTDNLLLKEQSVLLAQNSIPIPTSEAVASEACAHRVESVGAVPANPFLARAERMSALARERGLVDEPAAHVPPEPLHVVPDAPCDDDGYLDALAADTAPAPAPAPASPAAARAPRRPRGATRSTHPTIRAAIPRGEPCHRQSVELYLAAGLGVEHAPDALVEQVWLELRGHGVTVPEIQHAVWCYRRRAHEIHSPLQWLHATLMRQVACRDAAIGSVHAVAA